MRFIIVLILTGLLSSVESSSSGKNKKVCFDGQSCLDSDADGHIDLPITGFIQAESNHYPTKKASIRVLKKHHTPALCSTLTFVNPPVPNASPLVGANLFHLHTERLYNDHFMWSNGAEFISFIKHENGGNGNWILGNEAGVDSGYVYLESPQSALSPITFNTPYSTTNIWKWLQHGKWEDQPQMFMKCLDDTQEQGVGQHYYEVEYFPPDDRRAGHEFQPQHTTLLTNIQIEKYSKNHHKGLLSKLVRSDCDTEDEEDDTEESGVKLTPTSCQPSSGLVHAILDQNTMKYIPLSNIEIITTYGEVSTFVTKLGQEIPAVLVNVEHSTFAWRLTFRKVQPADVTLSYSQTSATNSNGKKKNAKKGASSSKSEDREISIEIDNTGVVHKDLKLVHQDISNDAVISMLNNIQVGDHLWSWQSVQTTSVDENDEEAEMIVPGSQQQIQEYVLECFAKHDNTLVFRVYEADRSKIMKQSMLSRDIDLLTIHLPSSSDEDVKLVGHYRQEVYGIHHMIFLGKQLVDLIADYIHDKEGKLGEISSCYMYHAAYSLPQPLLYANEILCVLLGAKPVTMIQYQSPSEHQWKFPYVSKLINAIVVAKTIYGDAFTFDYEIFRDHHDDETLIIYHQQHKAYMEALLPQYQAQALHPLPFIEEFQDNAKITAARERIYNSAYNGFVLGYPGRFVLSYCETLGDNVYVSLEEKRELVEQAKRDFIDKFGQLYEIKLGLSPGVVEEQMKLIRTLM